jgi:uncharacterized protein
MADRFVSDPHEVVRSGQVVRVKVLEVDVERQRISLTLRLTDDPKALRGPNSPERAPRPARDGVRQPPTQSGQRKLNRDRRSAPSQAGPPAGPMAQALRDAGFGR